MKIIFDLEASDQECAFFAIYAGLRMYMGVKKQQETRPDMLSVASAEAYCMLKSLEEQFPEEYKNAELEYNEVYGF